VTVRFTTHIGGIERAMHRGLTRRPVGEDISSDWWASDPRPSAANRTGSFSARSGSKGRRAERLDLSHSEAMHRHDSKQADKLLARDRNTPGTGRPGLRVDAGSPAEGPSWSVAPQLGLAYALIPVSSSRHGSSPSVHASCPGSRSTTSPGPIEISVPSSKRTVICPDRQIPVW
jgi:hypothetical protein